MGKKKAKPKSVASILPVERIENLIFLIRGQKVILDSDLAALYGVSTRRLNEQVRRNADRFPPSFMFPLAAKEFADLKSQFATSSWGGRRKLPNAFTEHGALMAASVLNSQTAIQVSIRIIEAFVQLRKIILSNQALARKVDEIESRLSEHDQHIAVLFAEIKDLLKPPDADPKGRIGYKTAKGKK